MIPDFIDLGPPTPWPVLPPGVHLASLSEVKDRFAHTPHRAALFAGLARAIAALEKAGCAVLYLDGSFVSAKPHPGDYDACWETKGVNPKLLDPVLLDFSGKREAQKRKYGGELFFAEQIIPGSFDFLGFFQTEKYSGKSKGILKIQLAPNKESIS